MKVIFYDKENGKRIFIDNVRWLHSIRNCFINGHYANAWVLKYLNEEPKVFMKKYYDIYDISEE